MRAFDVIIVLQFLLISSFALKFPKLNRKLSTSKNHVKISSEIVTPGPIVENNLYFQFQDIVESHLDLHESIITSHIENYVERWNRYENSQLARDINDTSVSGNEALDKYSDDIELLMSIAKKIMI